MALKFLKQLGIGPDRLLFARSNILREEIWHIFRGISPLNPLDLRQRTICFVNFVIQCGMVPKKLLSPIPMSPNFEHLFNDKGISL